MVGKGIERKLKSQKQTFPHPDIPQKKNFFPETDFLIKENDFYKEEKIKDLSTYCRTGPCFMFLFVCYRNWFKIQFSETFQALLNGPFFPLTLGRCMIYKFTPSPLTACEFIYRLVSKPLVAISRSKSASPRLRNILPQSPSGSIPSDASSRCFRFRPSPLPNGWTPGESER